MTQHLMVQKKWKSCCVWWLYQSNPCSAMRKGFTSIFVSFLSLFAVSIFLLHLLFLISIEMIQFLVGCICFSLIAIRSSIYTLSFLFLVIEEKDQLNFLVGILADILKLVSCYYFVSLSFNGPFMLHFTLTIDSFENSRAEYFLSHHTL